MRRRFLSVVTFLFGFGIVMGGFWLAHAAFVEAMNRRLIQDLAGQVVSRAEVAVDLTIIRLSNLIASGHTACDAASLAAIRRAAFALGSLKDVHVRADGAWCSGVGAADLVDLASATSSARYPARNRNIALMQVESADWRGLGVNWRVGERELVGLMSTDALLFDMLPSALRESGAIVLSVAPGVEVARYASQGWNDEARSTDRFLSRFEARSERYPLLADIAVEADALAAWNRAVQPWLAIGGLAFAVLVGFLLMRALPSRHDDAAALDEALAGGAIVPYVQPIVSLASHRIVGVEVLARWIEPDGTVVPPSRFIPLVEATGRSDRLMEALLRRVGETLAPLLRARADLKVTINAAPDQFLAEGFPERLGAWVAATAIPPTSLVVEITERGELASVETARTVVAALRTAGIRVAIDDVGTGHNGLASIQELGAAMLKVDKLFVDRVDGDHRTRSLVEMLVQVAREFDMSLVAEGIERPEQAAALLAIGVREGQGFLFARPMPVDALLARLDAEMQADEIAEDARHEAVRLRA